MSTLRKVFWSVFAITCLACENKTAALTNSVPKEATLQRALETFNEAFAMGNLTLLDSMTTENYIHTNSSTHAITKADWFTYLKRRSGQLKSGHLEVLDYELTEQQIAYHESAAIVTGKVTVKTRDSLSIKENAYRVTNFWVYEDGRWKRAGFHDGKIR